jgi:uncharacterized protein
MRPSELLDRNREAICAVVAAHRASNPRVFGSVLHGKDGEGSDLDLLVEPADGMSLFDIGAIRRKLHDLLGIDVDVVSSGRCRIISEMMCWLRQSRSDLCAGPRLQHMVEACALITVYTAGMSEDGFRNRR